MDKYVVVTVSSINKRDAVIKKMYSNLTADPVMNQTMTVVKDQVNRIRVYHNLSGGRRLLIKTYLVIVIPVSINLGSIYDITGDVVFELSETIKDLRALLKTLENLQGRRVMKGKSNGQAFEQLVRSLSTTHAGDRTS